MSSRWCSKNIPQYSRNKIPIGNSFPGRQRELKAQEGTDAIYERIAERTRFLNASDLVTVIDPYKKTGDWGKKYCGKAGG